MIIFLFSFWNCEKDDICADGTITTPKLVIEFYDATVTDSVVSIPSIAYFETSVNDTLRENEISQLLLPLKTNDDNVSFEMIFNGNDDDDTNDISDIISVNYTREDIYISRACGYKTNFTLTDIVLNSNNWITTDTIVQPSITNEDEVHLKIYY